jgi:hypothetical protein
VTIKFSLLLLSFSFLIGLGLGDTNYSSYQGFPISLSKKLIELGALSFYKRGEADDGIGYVV